MLVADNLRQDVLGAAQRYHAEAFAPQPFVLGETLIRPSDAHLDSDDLLATVDAALDMWFTAGHRVHGFEHDLAGTVGVEHALMVNSGSSANLLALTALTSRELGKRAIQRGDEVITVATGFPTTLNPILQCGLVPVFVDVMLPTYNASVAQVADAITPHTKAIMLAHALGNPFDLGAVVELARENDLWLIEDCCDALGATYEGQPVGSFGDFSTLSFYPAHQICSGEGGAVLTDNAQLKRLVASYRGWGRDCWCDAGENSACGHRFDKQFGQLPFGYDHKYVYSHIGYNMKATELQAALGSSQLKKLPEFVEKRNRNFAVMRELFEDLERFFILPEATPKSRPSWFGFPLTIRPGAPFGRRDLLAFLLEKSIDSRLMFGGNLLRQPAYADILHRIVADAILGTSLSRTDLVMRNSFWLGVHPGLSEEMLVYMADTVQAFCKGAA